MTELKNAGDIAEGAHVETSMVLGEGLEIPLKIWTRDPRSTCLSPLRGGPASFGPQTTFFAEAAIDGNRSLPDLPMGVEVAFLGSATEPALLTLKADARTIRDRAYADGGVGWIAWTLYSVTASIPKAIATGSVTVTDNGSFA